MPVGDFRMIAGGGTSDFDPRSRQYSAWRRWVAPLLAPRPLLHGLSWHLIGLTTLIAIPIHPGLALNSAQKANWAGALYWTLGHVLQGLLVLLLGIVLSNQRRWALPRAAAFALAVLLGVTVASAIVDLPWSLGVLERTELLSGNWIGDVLWLARQAALPWGFIAATCYFLQRASERAAALRDDELARRRLDTRMVEARRPAAPAGDDAPGLF
jgi:hypothetical protein